MKKPLAAFFAPVEDRILTLRPKCIRVKAMDLRIVSIAIETEPILLSRNPRDYRLVPGLIVEDWMT